MKRVLTKGLSVILILAGLLSCAVSTGATLAPLLIGDTDFDYEISILDATVIQRRIAEYDVGVSWYTDELQEAICDADGDGYVTILDATALQRHLVGLPNAYSARNYSDLHITDYYVGDAAFHSSCEILTGEIEEYEVAYVGVPVTFTAEEKWGARPRRYTLSVNGEVVEDVAVKGEKKHTFTFTFDKEGDYVVNTRMECRYGVSASRTRNITVRQMPDEGRPVIMGASFFDQSRLSSGDSILTVTALGGAAPYEYSYILSSDKLAVVPVPATDDQPIPFPPQIGTGYIKDSQINVLSRLGLSQSDCRMPLDANVRITVRDADGNVSDPVSVRFSFYELVA